MNYYDEPASIEWSWLATGVSQRIRKRGKPLKLLTYDFITCLRLRETIHVEPRDVVVAEGGILVTYRQ